MPCSIVCSAPSKTNAADGTMPSATPSLLRLASLHNAFTSTSGKLYNCYVISRRIFLFVSRCYKSV